MSSQVEMILAVVLMVGAIVIPILIYIRDRQKKS
jgi:hypothetical protein